MHRLEKWFNEHQVAHAIRNGKICCSVNMPGFAETGLIEHVYEGENWDGLEGEISGNHVVGANGDLLIVPYFTDDKEESKDPQSRAKQLAADHWNSWGKELLDASLTEQVSKEKVLKLLSLAYQGAMVHGFKLGVEDERLK